jgi:hypothetical protein
MTDVTLTETQCLYVRHLLFAELKVAAEALADLADAVEQHDHADLASLDAHSTFVNQVQLMAELLDTVGWAAGGDTARMNELESARVKAGA